MITFIEQGDRIAVENFEIGEIYTITFTNGNYKTMCCIGVGSDFVMFQDKLPSALFCLTLGTAEAVLTIDLGGGGSGTMNYNELENKPQINGVILIGNKTGSDLGLVSQSDLDSYVTDDDLTTALASKQDTLSAEQLTAVNSGITSSLVTQIGTNTTAISGKQDQLSVAQLTAVNSGITSTDVVQITTNKNNILFNVNNGVKNLLKNTAVSTVSNTVTFTVNDDKSIRVQGKPSSGIAEIVLSDLSELVDGQTYKLYGNQFTKHTSFQIIGGPGIDNVYATEEGTEWTFVRANYVRAVVRQDSEATTTDATIYPMITIPTITDSTYQPYAMSNAELTTAIQALQAQLANQ